MRWFRCALRLSRSAGGRLILLVVLALIAAPLGTVAAAVPFASSAIWPTYLGNVGRSGYNPLETAITTTTAPNLKLAWSAQDGSTISTQPVVANNRVYWGGWDGYQRATVASGSSVGQTNWSTFIGRTVDFSCNPSSAGPASTPTIASVTIDGVTRSVLFVGGGGNVDALGSPIPNATAQVLALDALTGAVIWQSPIGSSPENFAWSSPAFYGGSVYIGLSSFGDCPLVPGHLLKLNAQTGSIQNDFTAVPAGCSGVGVWGSPTIDTAAGTVYFTTGNAGSCGTVETYAQSVVELRLSDLSVVGSWAVPAAQSVSDGDFGSTPTLFSATINGTARRLVGAQNKNGVFYAFLRDNLTRGPIWYRRISNGGDCPQCGSANVSPASWDGKQLYVGGGQTRINGTVCQGTMKALDPSSGSVTWQRCLGGTIIGAVTSVPGVVAFGMYGSAAANNLLLLDSTTGNTVYSYPPAGTPQFYGAPTIVNGVLYIGDVGNTLYALSPQ